MPRSAITQSGLLVARMAARSPFLNPRLSRPQATAPHPFALSAPVKEYQRPARRPVRGLGSGQGVPAPAAAPGHGLVVGRRGDAMLEHLDDGTERRLAHGAAP